MFKLLLRSKIAIAAAAILQKLVVPLCGAFSVAISELRNHAWHLGKWKFWTVNLLSLTVDHIFLFTGSFSQTVQNAIYYLWSIAIFSWFTRRSFPLALHKVMVDMDNLEIEKKLIFKLFTRPTPSEIIVFLLFIYFLVLVIQLFFSMVSVDVLPLFVFF